MPKATWFVEKASIDAVDELLGRCRQTSACQTSRIFVSRWVIVTKKRDWVSHTYFSVSSLWLRMSWSMERRFSRQSWALLAVWWLRFVCWISAMIWSFSRHPSYPSGGHCSAQRWSSNRRRHPVVRERRRDETFWWDCSLLSFEANLPAVFEKLRHLRNLWIHVVDSMIKIRPTILIGEYYHRWMISEIHSSTMITYQERRTKERETKNSFVNVVSHSID